MTSSNEPQYAVEEDESVPPQAPAEETSTPPQDTVQSNVEEKDELPSGPDLRTWRYVRHGQVEYPFLHEEVEVDGEPVRRTITAKHGDERQWPDGPPNDGAWVALEEGE